MPTPNEVASPPPLEMARVAREVVHFFGRHLVSIWWVIDDGSWNIASGFILEACGYWTFITAGHVIHDINLASDRGALVGCHLVDTFGSEATHFNTIVLPYAKLPRWNVGYIGREEKETGADYGIILLNDLTRLCLEKNKVVPICEANWRDGKGHYDKFLLIGSPASGVEAPKTEPGGRPYLRRIKASVIDLEPIENPPPELVRSFDRWYGRVPGTKSIGGMSGCLLLGVKTGEPATYKPIGVQSGWLPDSRITAICPLEVFAAWVQDYVSRLMKSVNASSDGPE